MLSGIVSHLQNVKGDAVDARLAQGVEPGDVRTSVVDLLQGRGHFGVVVVLELDRAEGRVDGEADEEQKFRKHLGRRGRRMPSTSNHTETMNGRFCFSMEQRNRPLVHIHSLSFLSHTL